MTMAAANPTSMHLIINTRPATTADALQQALSQRHLPSVSLPGMLITGPDDPAMIGAHLRAALAADIWIFTSINAIEQCFLLLSTQPLPAAGWPLLAVLGSGSWHCLQQHLQAVKASDVEIISPAEADASNSEGLLQHPRLQQVAGKQVLLLNAPGGRDKLRTALHQRGASVNELAVYQRVAPALDDHALEQISAWPGGLLTVWTSSAAIGFLQQRFATTSARAAGLWQRIIHGQHLVLSAAQRRLLQQLDAVTITVASAPDPESLAQQVQRLVCSESG